MDTIEKKIFDAIKNLYTHSEEELLDLNGISVHDMSEPAYPEDEKYKVYHNLGYCWEVRRIFEGKEDHKEYPDYHYEFCEPWDGFKVSGPEKALRLISLIE